MKIRNIAAILVALTFSSTFSFAQTGEGQDQQSGGDPIIVAPVSDELVPAEVQDQKASSQAIETPGRPGMVIHNHNSMVVNNPVRTRYITRTRVVYREKTAAPKKAAVETLAQRKLREQKELAAYLARNPKGLAAPKKPGDEMNVSQLIMIIVVLAGIGLLVAIVFGLTRRPNLPATLAGLREAGTPDEPIRNDDGVRRSGSLSVFVTDGRNFARFRTGFSADGDHVPNRRGNRPNRPNRGGGQNPPPANPNP